MTKRYLTLRDGCAWQISASDDLAGRMVARLGGIMQLPAAKMQEPDTRQLILATSDKTNSLDDTMPAAVQAVRCGAPAHCDLELANADEDLWFAQIMVFSTLFGVEAQRRGGALIHGALAARPDLGGRADREGLAGILLAAQGGTGKTTASNRLPPPWVSLCDDSTLVVRDEKGNYWAHPWPTWSRFLWGGKGGSWNTHDAVRLRAIFFLEQARLDQATPLGAGHAAASLVKAIEQASCLMTRGFDDALARALRLEWFEVACALARCLPSFHLELTLAGAFWQEIERCLQQEPA